MRALGLPCPESVEITTPEERKFTLPVVGYGDGCCGVIKDAGDDPDSTGGILIKAAVELSPEPGAVTFLAGEGVGTVTLPGLKIAVGEPAINPVPRAMIERAVREVIGARGAIQMIYVDEQLSRAITADSRLQDWVYDMAQYYGTDATRKKRLFIAHIDVYKPWDFDYTQIFVGDYHLQKGDVLSPSMTNPFGPQPSKSDGFFAFVVPASAAKAGAEIKIGYGDDSETWKVPK